MNRFLELNAKLIELLKRADALKEYRAMWMARAEMSARDEVVCADTDILNVIKGQLSLCFEQADAAQAALDASKASANATDEEGLPQ